MAVIGGGIAGFCAAIALERIDGCERYRANQLSFIRLSGSHYNSPQDIEHFLSVTASLAGR